MDDFEFDNWVCDLQDTYDDLMDQDDGWWSRLDGRLIILGIVVFLSLGLIINNPDYGAAHAGLSSTPVPEFSNTGDVPQIEIGDIMGAGDAFWSNQFGQWGLTYRSPTVYTDATPQQTYCSLRAGPAYCPSEEIVIIHSGAIAMLPQLGSKITRGGVIYAYLHEIGHHVQKLANLEFAETQADCFAGQAMAYAKTKGIVTDTDIDDAIATAHALGVPNHFNRIDHRPHGTKNERREMTRASMKQPMELCFS